MDNISFFISQLPKFIADIFNSFDLDLRNKINEIRIRKSKPLIIYIIDKAYFINPDGSLSVKARENSLTVSQDDFEEICNKLCSNSYHTNMSTLVKGYVTAKNGSRVGVASTAVFKDNALYSVKDIASLCIRISHEYYNCAMPVIDLICTAGVPSIIVAGKPCSGKTTFLRDYSRLLSNGVTGEYKKVSIVDERKEIAAEFDVGVNTDVLSGFPKAQGIEMAVRTLAPDIIVCDELGSVTELDAVINGFSSGVSFAVSVHIKDEKQIFSNEILLKLIETNQFDYILLLKRYTDEFEIIDLGELNRENSRNDNDNPFFFFPWLDGGQH